MLPGDGEADVARFTANMVGANGGEQTDWRGWCGGEFRVFTSYRLPISEYVGSCRGTAQSASQIYKLRFYLFHHYVCRMRDDIINQSL